MHRETYTYTIKNTENGRRFKTSYTESAIYWPQNSRLTNKF